MSSRAGSHAGRGFRYQDVTAAHLAVMGLVGESPYGMIIPEGRDDVELRGPEFRVLCQIKSRRDHMGPFGAKAVAGFVKKMWGGEARTPTDRFLLILESDIDERSTLHSCFRELTSCRAVLAALKGSENVAANASRTQVLVLPSPRADALLHIAKALECTPQEADIYFADLLSVVGATADANGMRKPADYLGIGVSDVQQRFDALKPLLTSLAVEEALKTGLCAAVDFLTPDNDQLFYIGVDTQPAHVAAGLVVERPGLRTSVMAGLHDRRNVLVHGPSGSGKSAILWDAAYASRHAVRWFQIRRLPPDALSSLVHLARSRRATLDAPVGFIIDDVGRGLSEAWSSLAAEVGRTPGLLLLSSVREEDRYSLEDKHLARQIQVDSDTALAERIWNELRRRSQTNWQGWKEPWVKSNGHLLEYTHELTQGRRLRETLSEQIAIRMNDIRRHDELDVLRVVACANAAGCSAEVARIPETLGRSNAAVSMALTRLVNEHLVNDTGDGRVVGLHELRSAEILSLTHQFPPPVLSATAAAAVRVVPASELTQFLERTLSVHVGCDDATLSALAQRIQAECSAPLFAAIMKGLDLAHAHRVVREWLTTSEAQAVPKAHRELVGMFGLVGIDFPEIGQTIQLQSACRCLRDLRTAAAPSSLSQRCIALLDPKEIRRVADAAGDSRELTQVLTSLIGQVLPTPILNELSGLTPPVSDAAFDDIVALLNVTRALNRTVAIEWVNKIGQEALFERFVDNVSWVSKPTLTPCEEGIEVHADVWCITAAISANTNDAVVRICEILLALTPSAEIVSSDALGGNGQIQMMNSEYPLVQKRIRRDHLPGAAAVNRNRAWIQALKTHLATDSNTAYLSQCLEHLRVISKSLKILLDSALRNHSDGEALAALGRVHNESGTLVTPPTIKTGGTKSQRSSNLQSLLFDCSADVVRRFIHLPEGAPAYIGWIGDLLDRIDSTKTNEPWELLTSEPIEELEELTRILQGLRALAGEAFIRQQSPFTTHRNKRAKKGSAFDTACRAARRFHEVQLQELESKLRTELCSEEDACGLFLLRDATIPALWPPADVLMLVPIEHCGDLAERWTAWRAAIDDHRRICVLPISNGYGLTSFAVAGIETPIPAWNEADTWCDIAGIQPLPLRSVAAFTAITNPLVELDAIRNYWASKDGRTHVEQEVHDGLVCALKLHRANFDAVQIPIEVTDVVNQFVDAVLAGELKLASEASRMPTGEIGPATELLDQLLQALTGLDIAFVTGGASWTH